MVGNGFFNIWAKDLEKSDELEEIGWERQSLDGYIVKVLLRWSPLERIQQTEEKWEL